MNEAPAVQGSKTGHWRKHLLLVLRFVVPIAALAYILSKIPLSDVLASVRLVRFSAVMQSIAVLLFSMVLATARWRILFTACGTGAKPSFFGLFRVYWICLFYNAYLPGGVGGEVVRGLATRRAVGERGLANALGIVLLERTLGFTGMLILVVFGFTLFPLPGMSNVMLWSSLGMGAAVAAVGGIVSGRRLAPFLPQPLRRVAAALPTITSIPLFALALGLSLVTQLCGVVAGHVIIASISPEPSWADSLVILPLINALQYFPFTVGGAGVREVGFVALYPLVGVSRPDAMATSVVLWALQYVIFGPGGILHALRPLDQVDGL